jgi:CO dehydrogenase maturation factor
MKIAVSGKGGVGKTTVAALLTRALARRGGRVLAVDADPDANLALALGAGDRQPTPLAERKLLVEARTGVKPGSQGGYFRLNPVVDDLPEELSVDLDGVHLLVMGGVSSGGGGCVCPESALVRALVTHLVLAGDEALVLDMEAGLEHLGRGTARGVDHLIVVVEPGRRAVATALQVQRLAHDLAIEQVWLLANKLQGPEDLAFLAAKLPELPILGELASDARIVQADRDGAPPWAHAPELLEVATGWLDRLAGLCKPAGRM